MKTSALVLFFCIATTKAVFSYEITLSGGTIGHDSVNLPDIMGGRHWDSFSIANTPGQGEHLGFLFGNHFALGTYVSVMPELGDQAAGTIQLSLHYQIKQLLSLTFANYQSAACDFHYGFQVAIRPDAFSPAIASFSLAPGSSDVVLDFEVGTQAYLDFIVDPSYVNDAHDSWAWHPGVIDPSSPGLASLELSGAIKPLSLQVISAVPEPSSLALGAMGFALMALSSRKPHA